MWSLSLTEDELAWLSQYHFDPKLEISLRNRFVKDELSREANRLPEGKVQLPRGIDLESAIEDLPSRGSYSYDELEEIGSEAVAQGKVGLLILNGGMATRFGGAVKGVVPVVEDLSFLGLKLAAAGLLAERAGGEIPIYLMNSFATHEPTMEHLEKNRYFGYPPGLIKPFLQNTLLRLTPEGALFRLNDGAISPYGPGHGDIVDAMARGPLLDMQERGIEALHMSNVDNVLATPDPVIFGIHLLGETEMTIEIVRSTGEDVGGAPAVVEGKLQIVEAFRFPDAFPLDRLTDFNTNTFCFTPSSLGGEFPLSWFVVTKQVGDRQAIQFERLAGQLSAFLHCHFIRVDRVGPDSRFSPIKDRPTLQRERNRIIGTLTQRDFFPTPGDLL